MAYSDAQLVELETERLAVLDSLHGLQIECIEHGQRYEGNPQLREHLTYGVGRRVGTLRRSIQNIFEALPPDSTTRLPGDRLKDAEVNLHAFVINLAGVFDNWAWAFVLRHNIQHQVGQPQNIGLFVDATARHFPEQIRPYVSSSTFVAWHSIYAKDYRDALAHRIPLYIPPAVSSPEEASRLKALKAEEHACLEKRDLERFEAIQAEKKSMGKPCFAFFHSFAGKSAAKPVQLHPQLICDAKLVVEFGTLYFRHWDSAC